MPEESSAAPPKPPWSLRRFLRGLMLVSTALLLPVLPLIVLGLAFEEQVESRLDRPMRLGDRFSLIVGLLAVDLALPVPSSAVSTYGGGRIGFLPAALASFLGMTIGSGIGYCVAWWLGESFARKAIGESDFNRVQKLAARIGPAALIVTRPLPLLAEACVILLGAVRVKAMRFWPSLLIGNAIVSAVYAAFGAAFPDRDGLPAAIIVSAVVPFLLTGVVRLFWRREWENAGAYAPVAAVGNDRPRSGEGEAPAEPDR